LVLIESATTRDRYLKLLRTADIETDVASDLNNALQQLAARLHALLFTALKPRDRRTSSVIACTDPRPGKSATPMRGPE
jgi:hypothetical protein